MPSSHLKIVMVLTILLSGGFKVLAQKPVGYEPSMNNITPPSPGAAALGKFGDLPIGPATGIPQINVPLYSYSNADKSLSLDLTLDYHAGGVRVDEMASNVGIGWSLGAGGAITRTVRDIYDEASSWGFINAPVVLNEMEGNKPSGYGTSTSWFHTISSSAADGQNDIFSFNFSGRSGKFMYGRNGDFLMLTSNKLKIEKEHGAVLGQVVTDMIKKFTVTDENGAKYVFDTVEFSDNGTTSGYHIHTSTWYLTKIIAPFSTDSILFTYEDEYSRYTAGRSVTRTYCKDRGAPPQSVSYTTVITTGKRLSKISFPNGISANFVYDTALRTDQESGSSMSRVKQINITDGANIRGYNLYHDYSVNRLTLRKVLPFAANVEESGYQFNYYGVLPDRLNYEQDHWGYYNTNPSMDLIPPYSDLDVSLFGGNRETDPERVKYGSLSRMIYPTGGHTDFEMECNQAEDPLLSRTTITLVKEKKQTSSIYCNSATPVTESFSFNGDPGSKGVFAATVFTNGTCTGGACNFVIQLKNSSNQVLTTKVIANDESAQYKTESFEVLNMQPGTHYWYVYTQGMNYQNYITITSTERHDLHPDTIKTTIKHPEMGGLRVKSIKNYDGIGSTPVSTREFEYLLENSNVPSGTLGVYPQYSYPVFYEYWENIHIYPEYMSYVGYGLSPNAIVRVSSSVQPMASIKGSPIIYSRVVEKITGNSQSNGRIVRSFNAFPAGGVGGYNVYPFTPSGYEEWDYGQLKDEKIYNANDVLVKQSVNEYVRTLDNYYNSANRLRNFTSIAIGPLKYEWNVPNNGTAFNWGFVTRPVYYGARTFTPAAGRVDLAKTTVTEYFNGNSSVSQVQYDYDTAFNVKRVITIDSRDNILEEVIYYPYEYNTPIALAMKGKNMYASGIAMEKWKTKPSGKYLIGGYVNQYSQFSSGIRKSGISSFNSIGAVLSSSVAAFNPSSFNRDITLFKDLISFDRYNAKGYLDQQSKVNNVNYAYLYGYGNNYVIAEVMNAAVNEIAYTGFEDDNTGNWIFQGTPVSNAMALSGNKIYNLSSGSISANNINPGRAYRVSYWSLSGTATVGSVAAKKGATRNGWTYFEHNLPAGLSTLSITGSGYIDELRLYPINATMKTYTYTPLIGITSICDINNEHTYYLYDGFGRLSIVKNKDRDVLKLYDYQFQTAITK